MTHDSQQPGADPIGRRPYVAGNWKMYKTVADAEAFVGALLPRISGEDVAEVVICPPFTALGPLVDSTRGSRVKIAAQNMNAEPEGAFTGEVSAPMLTELGVAAVVIGHSERRHLFAETDAAVAAKVAVAFAAGLEPIACVGETADERKRGATEERLRVQVQVALSAVPDDRLGEVVVAYEPVWAIGTGDVATPDQAEAAIAFIRSLIAGRDSAAAERARILYGGSVKLENAGELLALPNVDGALIGGASLDPAGFAEIVAIADRAGAR